MNKKLFIICLINICLINICLVNISFACTTVIVGRKASTDGSHFVGRTVDISSFLISKLQYIPASNTKQPVIYRDNTVNLELRLPETSYECFAIPTNQTIYEGNTSALASKDFWWESVINEKRVGISATETINVNLNALAKDPFVKSGLREGNIPRLVIPYVSSAKEGVLRLAKLVEKYGMVSPEAVIFIDDKEIWYMEIYTGHRYAAQRMPEDCCACIPNDAMLGFYDKNDRENWIASKDIVEFAKKTGVYREIDGRFHLALSYGTERRDDSQLRIWAGRRYFTPNIAGEYDEHKYYSIFFKPEKKISLIDAFELTRDRHEGTPQATDKHGNNTRPIGVDRITQSHFIQFRKDSTPPILWASLAAPEFSVYFPILGLPDKINKNFTYYSLNYDSNSFVWKLLEIGGVATSNRKQYSHIVRSRFSALEKNFVASLDALENKFKSQGANSVLADVTQQAEKAVNEVQAKIFKAVAVKRIDDTKFLGMGRVDEITAKIFKQMSKNKPDISQKSHDEKQDVELKADLPQTINTQKNDVPESYTKPKVEEPKAEKNPEPIENNKPDISGLSQQNKVDVLRLKIFKELTEKKNANKKASVKNQSDKLKKKTKTNRNK